MSLEGAAIQLLGRTPTDNHPLHENKIERENSKLLKTKVRRLYDIANILSSLNLIEKVHTMYRKPAFKWLGPEASCSAVLALRQEASKRAASTMSCDDREPARASTKRRRVSNSQEAHHDQVSSEAHDLTETGATVLNTAPEEGLDVETLAKIEFVLGSFPEEYAIQWRDYVKSVNLMLMRGQVSNEKAYESVATVVSQYERVAAGLIKKSSGEDDAQAVKENEDQEKLPPEGVGEQHSQVCFEENGKDEAMINEVANDQITCAEQKETLNNPDLVNDATESLAAVAMCGNTTETGLQEANLNVHFNGHSESGLDQSRGGAESSAATSQKELKQECVELAESAAEIKQDGRSSEPRASGSGKPNRSPKQSARKNCKAEKVSNEQAPAEVLNTNGEVGVDVAVNDIVVPGGEGIVRLNGCEGYETTRWSQEYIDSYMQKAKDAGPEYEIAAQSWLQRYRTWEKMWASQMGNLAAMASLTNGVVATVADVQPNMVADNFTPQTGSVANGVGDNHLA